MKKIIPFLIVTLFPFITMASTISVSPNPVENENTPLVLTTTGIISSDFDCFSNTDPQVLIEAYKPDGTFSNSVFSDSFITYGDTWNDGMSSNDYGLWNFVSFNRYQFDGNESCVGHEDPGTLEEALSSEFYTGTNYLITLGSLTPTGLQSVIFNSNNKISQSFGFGISDGVNYMKSLLFLLIGSALGITKSLVSYIIVIVIISVIIGMLYLAFLFFKN